MWEKRWQECQTTLTFQPLFVRKTLARRFWITLCFVNPSHPSVNAKTKFDRKETEVEDKSEKCLTTLPGCYSNTGNCVNCISNLEPVHTNLPSLLWGCVVEFTSHLRLHFLNIGLIRPDGRFTSTSSFVLDFNSISWIGFHYDIVRGSVIQPIGLLAETRLIMKWTRINWNFFIWVSKSFPSSSCLNGTLWTKRLNAQEV